MQWDDPKSYGYTATHTVKDWGWEFIKRDSRYISEWQERLDAFQKLDINTTFGLDGVLSAELSHEDISEYSDLNAPCLFSKPEGAETPEEISESKISPELICGSPVISLNRTNYNIIDTFIIPHSQAFKWGLRFYQAPKVTRLLPTTFLSVKMLFIGDVAAEMDFIKISPKTDTLISIIDLLKPLNKQIDEIAEKAKAIQETLKRIGTTSLRMRAETPTDTNRNLWTRYLQCLDAKTAGVSRQKAARAIFNNLANEAVPELAWDKSLTQIGNMADSYYDLFMS